MARIHFVPHTHWDREWYLPFQEFRIKLVHLIDRLLEILQTDEQFKYFLLDGQTILLEDYLAIRPDAREQIEKFVRAGRLQIGPWYVLPDEFLVSPEALIRNLLMGRSICQQFGSAMDIGYLPDPFGHISQLPQILNGFSIDRAAFRRGLSDEAVELIWAANAGTRLLVSYLRDGYDNAARAPEDPQAFQKFVRAAAGSLEPHLQTSQVLLLNGTDHHEPQRSIGSLISAFDDSEHELLFSNLELYFHDLEQEMKQHDLELPKISGELRSPKRHHLLAGTLSSRIRIKQRNHHCETLLERWAEPFATWANLYRDELPDRQLWTGHLQTPLLQDPQALLDEAWRILLSCHPHDSICGCSIDQVHTEMEPRFAMVEQIANEISAQSLNALAGLVDTSSLETSNCRSGLVVFNGAASQKSGRVRCRFELPAGLDPFEIVDDKGQIAPFRLLRREARSLADLELDAEGLLGMLAYVDGGEVMGLAIQDAALIERQDDWLLDVTVAENAPPNMALVDTLLPEIRTRIEGASETLFQLSVRFATVVEIEFIAHQVPSFGYRSFGLRPANAGTLRTTQEDHSLKIQNKFFDVEVQENGTLTVHDLQGGNEYSGLAQLIDEADRGDSYTFCPIDGGQPKRLDCEVENPIRRRDSLGSSITYDVVFELPAGLSPDRETRLPDKIQHRAEITVSLLEGAPRVHLSVSFENAARDHRLQLQFPSGLPTQKAHFDGHFEIISRPTNPPEEKSGWAEQPTAEQPVRRFVAVHKDGSGLLIANRGLREASVSPEGDIRITLLRAFGWLSRDDLQTRQGGAGPQIPTPGGQAIGEHHYEFAIIPIHSDFFEAVTLADQFQTTMRATATPIHKGRLEGTCSFVKADKSEFEISAIKPAESKNGIVVRGVNLSSREIETKLEFGVPIEHAGLLKLDETFKESLPIEQASRIHLALKGGEIVTIMVIPQR